MKNTQELEYAAYESRQRYEITAEQLSVRSKELKPGNKFLPAPEGGWSPQSYPGFAMQAMMLPEGSNSNTYNHLEAIRNRLVEGYDSCLAPLPSPSFHQTIANIFSAHRLEENVTSKGLLKAFPNLVAGAVKDIFPPEDQSPIVMNLIGLSFFRTAIGALGVFEDQAHFERILRFREAFYSHRKLVALGVERTRPFIGHVTLAYVEGDPDEETREKLTQRAAEINQQEFASPLPFEFKLTQFCRYDDLSAYHYKYDYPSARI